MSWSEVIIGTLVAILVLFAIVSMMYLLVKYIRPKPPTYTREYFAFHAFIACSAITTSVIGLLIGGQSFFKFIAVVSYHLLGINAEQYEPGFSDKSLAVVTSIALMYLAYKLHDSWRGQSARKSIRRNSLA